MCAAPVLINCGGQSGATALIDAAMYGSTDTMQALIDAGAKLDAADEVFSADSQIRMMSVWDCSWGTLH